ncbi:Ankyrin repeat domain containing protein [Pandoravirus neocaledonia]|uniref:Ankyrin repeat domain containing protein n=1 Tax=Pandoravirus neocaledonia TaxID=2107708 RepID=A0A2U7UCU9_9VIRU|nr:Ankyrin repeat domain containing protein [Pandoravirus neocaledonia]AVK76222.1 Ankyrin repeat domain containing protein [Pandoravirus neocaledonia]
MNETIPTEILHRILSLVGRRPQVPFVCRLWRAIAQDETFCRHQYRSDKAVSGIGYGTYSAREGLVGLLQWAYDEGCPVDDRVIAAAASRGHLDLVRWLHDKGHPWGEETCSVAARGQR